MIGVVFGQGLSRNCSFEREFLQQKANTTKNSDRIGGTFMLLSFSTPVASSTCCESNPARCDDESWKLPLCSPCIASRSAVSQHQGEQKPLQRRTPCKECYTHVRFRRACHTCAVVLGLHRKTRGTSSICYLPQETSRECCLPCVRQGAQHAVFLLEEACCKALRDIAKAEDIPFPSYIVLSNCQNL